MDPAPQHGFDAASPLPPRRADRLGIAACVVVACLILSLSWFKLGSLDTGYHIAYGGHFLDTGNIVDIDPFLYPETAKSFVNANWGSQVVMALAERIAGAAGLIALRTVLIAIIFACIAAALRLTIRAPNSQSSIVNRQSSIVPWLAWTWLLAGMVGYERFSMRPELFSYAAMTVMLLLLMRGLHSWRSIAALGVLQLFWVNLHSYFLVGVLMTGAWLVGSALSPRRSTSRARTSARPGRGLRLVAIALAVQAAVCFVNPWHYRGAIFPVITLQFLHGEDVMGGAAGDASRSAWSEISEFQSPFSFAGEMICGRTIDAYYVLLAVFVIGLIALLARRRFGPALIVLLLLLMSLKMRRNIAQFAFVAAPLCLGAIAAAVPWSAFDTRLRRFARPVAAGIAIALASWWIVGICDGRFYYSERRVTREVGTGYSERTFQRGAAEWLAAHPSVQPRLFVDYFSSSNTLQWLPDRFKLYVVTNTFAYEDDTLNTAFKLGLGQTDHNKFFGDHNVRAVLLHCGPDTQMLVRGMVADETMWSLVYFDKHSVLFLRQIDAHNQVILNNQVAAGDLDPREWSASLTGADRARALAMNTAASVPLCLGWYEPARTLLGETVRLAPDYHEAWTNLGLCHGMLANAAIRAQDRETILSELKAAVRCFKTALRIEPDFETAKANLRRAQSQLRAGS